MHEALLVGAIQRPGNLDGNRQCLPQRKWSGREAISKRLALQVLHNQEVEAVMTADVVERADVRMIESGNRAGLALETTAELQIGADVPSQNFDRDGPLQAGISRTIHLTHAAGAQGGDDLVNRPTRVPGESANWPSIPASPDGLDTLEPSLIDCSSAPENRVDDAHMRRCSRVLP